MNTRTKIIIIAVALLTSFSAGRFLSPTKTKTEVKEVLVDKIIVKTEHKIITIHEKPDGTKDTTVVSNTTTDSKSDSNSKTSTKEVVGSKSTLNVSVLASTQLPLTSNNVAFGAAITKSVIGPITATAFGLSNGTFGLGLGLNF